MIAQIARINRRATSRQSSDTCWPLRGVDGLTYAERARAAAEKADREARAAYRRHLEEIADAVMAQSSPAATSPDLPSRTRNPHPSAVEVGARATGIETP